MKLNEIDFTKPHYMPLQKAIAKIPVREWPDHPCLQQTLEFLHGPVMNRCGHKIQFVKQGNKSQCFEDHYEPRIYLKGEVQTRKNFHDFFHALVWMCFPQCKLYLNEIHFFAIKQRFQRNPHQRSKTENALTLFDECGIFVISQDKMLLDAIKAHAWEDLFWKQKDKFLDRVKCITFGHAIYEKLLNPFPGLCAKAILVYDNKPDSQGWDHWLLDQLKKVPFEQGPQILQAMPILGIPGWYGGQNLQFYQNRSYFRPKDYS